MPAEDRQAVQRRSPAPAMPAENGGEVHHVKEPRLEGQEERHDTGQKEGLEGGGAGRRRPKMT